MASLTINGFDIPVTGWREAIEEDGERGRAFSGKAWSSIRSSVRRWVARVTTSDPREAECLRALILGEGFNWSFDTDFYADGKGLPPIGTTGASLISAMPAPKFGAKCLKMDAAQYLYFQGDARRALAWTIALWRYESAAWHHYVISYDNGTWRKWCDGASVSAGYSTPFASVNASGQMVLGELLVASYFDDVIWLPVLVPDSWPAVIYARGAAWPNLPNLEVAGDLLPSSALYNCRGLSVGESEATNRGAASGRLESFDITFAEE